MSGAATLMPFETDDHIEKTVPVQVGDPVAVAPGGKVDVGRGPGPAVVAEPCGPQHQILVPIIVEIGDRQLLVQGGRRQLPPGPGFAGRIPGHGQGLHPGARNVPGQGRLQHPSFKTANGGALQEVPAARCDVREHVKRPVAPVPSPGEVGVGIGTLALRAERIEVAVAVEVV